jgi:hypothetical protein
MSGPLLLGIAAVGVTWAYVTRDVKATVLAVEVSPPAPDSDKAVVATQIAPGDGIDGVTKAVGCSDAKTVGDVPVAGSDGGQVLPVDYKAIEGGLIIGDGTKSTGGADPATQATRIHTGEPFESPPFISGDTQTAILESVYGPSGAAGLTSAQISETLRENALWSREVF